MNQAATTPMAAQEQLPSSILPFPPVSLDQFEGPLDVLLHLIRSQKLDIFDIPIALITDQYLQILDTMQNLNLEAAGDYLVMASTLMQLKSRMLLPRPEVDEEGNEIDPREELVAQLMAYEQFRILAGELNDLPQCGRDVFLRSVFPEAEAVERPLPEADLDALLVAFRHVLKRIGGEVRHHIFAETISIREQMGFILERLKKGGILLQDLFREKPGKEAVVTTILALLELWRQRSITVIQSESYGSISLLPGGVE